MTLKSWSGWSWWSNTNHHQLRQHCAATTEACKTAGSASPRWCTPGIAVPATTTPAKPKYRMFATTFTSSEANLCCRRKKHWLENCAASSTGLLCCVCLEVFTQEVLHKWLQATLFSDTHRQVAQNKSWHCSSPSCSGAFATDCSRVTWRQACTLQLLRKRTSCKEQRKRAYHHQMASWLQILINSWHWNRWSKRQMPWTCMSDNMSKQKAWCCCWKLACNEGKCIAAASQICRQSCTQSRVIPLAQLVMALSAVFHQVL